MLGGLLCCLAGTPVARAEEYEETEHRLKSAGIEPEMREEIRSSIRRGVRYLVASYDTSGGEFPGRELRGGPLALVGLALRHSAIPDGVRAGRRALDHLLRHEWRDLTERTYEAGILGMLLMADARPHPAAREIHERLARGAAMGSWGYVSSGDSGSANLSTSQFACLGLWSTERMGVPSVPAAWHDHLASLVRAQAEDGSWGYYASRPARLDGYPTGTFMGLADLVLAVHAVADRLAEDPQRRAEAIVARHRGLAALRRHAAWVLDGVVARTSDVSDFGCYRLFALEKVALFLGEESIAGRAWYRDGARALLGAQRPDGSWTGASAAWGAPVGQGNAVDTALALLFLLRVSESYRPITPRPVDRPPPTTPGDAPAPAPVPVPAEPREPGALGLPLAFVILERLERYVEAPSEDGFATALDAVRFVRRTWPTYRPGGAHRSEMHDAWCRRAQEVLLRAALDRPERPPRARGLAHAMVLEATDALGETDGTIGPALLTALERAPSNTSWPVPVLYAWRSSALDTLRRVDSSILPAWLARRGLGTGALEWPETSAALTVAGGLAGLRGAERRALLESAFARLDAMLARRISEEAWTSGLEADLLALARRLSGAPVAPDAWRAQRAPALRAWWREHGGADDPLWRDP